jgi:hypothetical protein
MRRLSKDEQLAAWVDDAARKEALELEPQLPWGLKELREYGRRGAAEALKRDAKWSGLSFPQHMRLHIKREVKKGGKAISESGKKLPASDERIEDALRTFSVKQWKHLIGEFGYEDASKLGFYLYAHRGVLEKSLEKENVGRIEAYARKRRLCLVLSNPKARWISVTDPLWAQALRQYARAKCLEAVRNPELVDERVPEAFQNIAEEIGAKDFTELKAYLEQEALHELLGVLEEEKSELPGWAEMASDRNVAKILNKSLRKSPDDLVTPYLVGAWRSRNKHTPPSEFDGSFSDYLYYVRDPSAYKRLLEHHRRSGKSGAG